MRGCQPVGFKIVTAMIPAPDKGPPTRTWHHQRQSVSIQLLDKDRNSNPSGLKFSSIGGTGLTSGQRADRPRRGIRNMAEETTETTAAPQTDEQRDELASQIVDRFSLWSGAAGLIPVPLVDIAAVGGLQLQMLRRISEVYGVPFSSNRGKSIIARDRKSTRLNSSHIPLSRMPSSA